MFALRNAASASRHFCIESPVSKAGRQVVSFSTKRQIDRPYSLLEAAQAFRGSRNSLRLHSASNRMLRPRHTFARFNGSKSTPNPTPHLNSPEPALTLSQRLKKLSKEYGWAALGVYLGLSALDFPFCFLAVRLLGTERIGRWEHAVVDTFWSVVRVPFPNLGKQAGDSGEVEAASPNANLDLDVTNAEDFGSNATIWTQLALAYAVHKSLIVFRVPLTAAVLPKVVKVLRGWGWKIGKKPVPNV